MKNKEELAYNFSERFVDLTDENSHYEAQAALIGHLAGWNSAEEKIEQIVKQLQKEDITSVVYALREVIKRMKE